MNFSSNFNPLLFLESLCHAHTLPQDHTPILQRLFIILESEAHLFPLYSSNLAFYLKKNIEYGIKIMETLDCLVYAQSLLTKQDRQRITAFLGERYKLIEGWEQLKKLQNINKDLVVPYLWVLSKVSEWRRIECQEREFRQVEIMYLSQQLQVLYTLSRYCFEQNEEVTGLFPEQALLAIYRVCAQNHRLFEEFIKEQNCLTKLYTSLFYLSAHCLLPYSEADFKSEALSLSSCFQQEDIFRGTKVFVFVMGEILDWIQRTSKGTEKLILCSKYGLKVEIARKNEEKKKGLLEKLKAATTALIACQRSLDNQFRWVWFTKIVLDLLQLPPIPQRSIIQEIQLRAKQFANFLELLHY